MKITKKSQAALEFLMTYGWAILVVLVAIGALAYFGVLSPDRFLPNRCNLQAGLSCVDFKLDASDNTITVVIQNSLGFDISAITVTAEKCGTSTTPATLNNGAEGTYTTGVCTTPLVIGARYKGFLTVDYTNTETTVEHRNVGSITARVEP